MSSRGQEKKAGADVAPRKKTLESELGIILPGRRVKILSKKIHGKSMGKEPTFGMSATCELLVERIVRGSVDEIKMKSGKNASRIMPACIDAAISKDPELNRYIGSVYVTRSGVVHTIPEYSRLLTDKQKKERDRRRQRERRAREKRKKEEAKRMALENGGGGEAAVSKEESSASAPAEQNGNDTGSKRKKNADASGGGSKRKKTDE